MSEKFDKAFIEGVKDYEVPLSEEVVRKLSNKITKGLRDTDRWLSVADAATKRGGLEGLIMTLAADPTFTRSYEDARRTKQTHFNYKNKRYKITPQMDAMMDTMTPAMRNKGRL